MKHCSYCNTDYATYGTKCPSCGAVDAQIKCDNCGTVHNGAFCPNCGLGIHEELRNCPKCGYRTKERICPKCGNDVASTATLKGAVVAVASKAACKISGHNWVGCKCARCGETRDEGHKYWSVEGKCEQKCSVCGKTEKIHQWNGSKCVRCGERKSRAMLGLAIMLILLWAGLGIKPLLNSVLHQEGDINIPASSSEFVGRSYQAVVKELNEAGFTNVKTRALEDLKIGLFADEGEVDEVKVYSRYFTYSDFDTDSWEPSNVKIVVSYHSYPLTNEETP